MNGEGQHRIHENLRVSNYVCGTKLIVQDPDATPKGVRVDIGSSEPPLSVFAAEGPSRMQNPAVVENNTGPPLHLSLEYGIIGLNQLLENLCAFDIASQS